MTAIQIPKAAPGACFGFYELARRHGDYAMAGVAIAARGAEPLSSPRIAFFSVAQRAVRAPAAEAALEGWAPAKTDALATARASLDDIAFEGDLNASPD